MNHVAKYANPAARASMSANFLLSGFAKLGALGGTAAYMTAYGVPGALVWPAIALELGAGSLLLAGLFTRPVALLLAGFSLVTGLIFHSQFGNQIQTIMFLKNPAMAGGFLLLAKDEAPAYSVDRLRARRAAVLA